MVMVAPRIRTPRRIKWCLQRHRMPAQALHHLGNHLIRPDADMRAV